MNDTPIDVWLRIPPGEEESEAEANTYQHGGGYRVDWYLSSVGLVTSRYFAEYSGAQSWLEEQGFEDYSS